MLETDCSELILKSQHLQQQLTQCQNVSLQQQSVIEQLKVSLSESQEKLKLIRRDYQKLNHEST